MADLWAITCYFNPMGYQRRLANYRVFRERLNVPLITVEWAWSQGVGYQLAQGDADVLIQVSSPDLLWQKERLLNIALDALPAECRYVAWLDCDVVFDERGWPSQAVRMLDDCPMIHLGDRACDMNREDVMDDNSRLIATNAPTLQSMVTGRAAGQVSDDLFLRNIRLGGYMAGFGWAMGRDLIDRHRLYDACVCGSGNRAIVCAAYGLFAQGMNYLKMTPAWSEHYLAWAEPLHDDIQGRVGCLTGRMLHLWHGDLKRRQYANRHRILRDNDFDPAADLMIDDNGCWRWNTEKPAMHTALRDYFASRREDG